MGVEVPPCHQVTLSVHLSTLCSSVFILRGNLTASSSGLAAFGWAGPGKAQPFFLNSSNWSSRLELDWPDLGPMSMSALTTRARKVEYAGGVCQRAHQWRQETKSEESELSLTWPEGQFSSIKVLGPRREDAGWVWIINVSSNPSSTSIICFVSISVCPFYSGKCYALFISGSQQRLEWYQGPGKHCECLWNWIEV